MVEISGQGLLVGAGQDLLTWWICQDRGYWWGPGTVIKKKTLNSPTTAEFSAICHLRELYFHILRISALQSFALRHMKHGWECLLKTVRYV